MKNDPDKMVVQITVGELRAIVREELAAAKKQDEHPQWVNVDAAAKHAGAHPKTVKRWITAGLPATKLGRDYRLRISDLDAWLESHIKKAS